jgi:HK97 family phage major capsid protein
MPIYQALQDLGAWKKDQFTEDIPEPMAAPFLATNVLKRLDPTELTRAQVYKEVGLMEERLTARLQEMARTIAGSIKTGPPGSGATYSHEGVAAANVRPGTAAAERGTKCFADILRCIFIVQARGAPGGQVAVANQRLKQHYGFDETEWRVDETTGRFFEVRTDEAGVQYRTGTESLSGGPTYGFLVKPEWYQTLYRVMIEESILLDDAFQVPIGNTLELKWPALDQFGTPVAGQSSAYAGVIVTRAGETQQRIYSDGKVNEITFKITDLTGFSTLSRDLIADNFIAADALIQELFGMAFAWKFDYECLRSPGEGAPTGVFNSTALIKGGGNAGHTGRITSSHIYFEDLAWMLSVLHPSCWKDAFWVTNVTTMTDLLAIKNSGGTYVYQPNALISQAMVPTFKDSITTGGYKFRAGGQMLGFPVKFSEKVPILGTAGDLTLIHPKSYGIAQRSGLEVGMSEHFLFDTDTIAFRFKMRNDARPLWRAAYQQADGSNTSVSPFIQLV